MVAVLHIIPGHPDNGIPFQPRIPEFLQVSVLDIFPGPDGSGLFVSCKIDQNRNLVVRQAVIVVPLHVPVRLDLLRVKAVFPGCILGLLQIPAHLNQNIGLPLRILLIGISEVYPGVFHHLSTDVSLCLLPRLNVRVKPGI